MLNNLFGTQFNVMSETERRQTTKGIWMSKNKRGSMADNILVMDVEGTDGRERGEDQDFERKSALFALATSEVLIVNIWEHQVGLYQGANMGLLKTVFEVNLQIFQKDRQYVYYTKRLRDHFLIHLANPLSPLFLGPLQDLSFSSSFVTILATHPYRISEIPWCKISRKSGPRFRSLKAWRPRG